MNHKYLSKIFATLLGISLAFNAYQAIRYHPIKNEHELRQQNYAQQILIYEKILAESEEKARKNKENLGMLEKRVEKIEKKLSKNYLPKFNEYDTKRVL